MKNIRIDFHAKKRFMDRYGLKFNHAMKMDLINRVWDGRAKLIQKTSNARSIYKVELDGTMIDFIYDRRRKKIIMALFPDQNEGLEI